MVKYLWLRVAGAIVLALYTAAATALEVREIATLGAKWIPFITFVVFVVIMFWIVYDLNKANIRLLDDKPSISISADSINEVRYLKVINDGADGLFSAQLSVVRAKGSSIGEEYDAIWERTNTNESKLMQGQSDYIKVASVRLTRSESFFELHAYDGASKSERIVKSIKCEPLLLKGTKPVFGIQVNLFSSPNLKDGAFVRAYSVGLSGIFPSKINTKLTTIPAKYIDL